MNGLISKNGGPMRCVMCGTTEDVCSSCSHCQEHHADSIVKQLKNLVGYEVDGVAAELKRRGGKWAILSDLLTGEIDADEADRRFNALKDDDA
jgi:hypothetical protein